MRKSYTKKFMTCMLVGLLLSSCSNEEFIETEHNTQINEQIRTIAEVKDIALSSLVNSGDGENRGEVRHISSDSQIIPWGLTSLSRSAETDTLLYIVNFDNNQGFAVIPALPYAEPCLAMVESGYYNPYSETGITEFDAMMTAAKGYVVSLSESGIKDPILGYNDSIVVKQVLPLHDMRWGMDYPEGLYAPNGNGGCVPVAAAYALSYCKMPSSIELTYLSNPSTLNLDWNALTKHLQSERSLDSYQQHLLECPANEATHNNLAHLIRELGHRLNANYNSTTNETSANHADLRLLLTNYLGSGRVDPAYSEWASNEETIKERLSNKNILLLRSNVKGYDGTSYTGHMFMCDGFKEYQIVEYVINRVDGEETLIPSGNTSKAEYFHINWGWAGNYNGYFSSTIMRPREAQSYDWPDPGRWAMYIMYNIQYVGISK